MWKNKYAMMIVLACLCACGQKPNDATTLSIQLSLNPVADQNLSLLTSEIEMYRFHFTGKSTNFTQDIERKKYSQFTFSNIDAGQDLSIQVQALDAHADILCEGESVIHFQEHSNQQILIALRCPF